MFWTVLALSDFDYFTELWYVYMYKKSPEAIPFDRFNIIPVILERGKHTVPSIGPLLSVCLTNLVTNFFPSKKSDFLNET